MEIIEIGKKQLIFLLERTEVCEYDLDKSQNSTVMRSGFRRLITDYGFDGDFLSDVLVQIFDSKCGGLEMFVTKLEESESLTGDKNLKIKMATYMFSNVDTLTGACKMLSLTNTGNSLVYYDTQKKKYFLTLEEDCPYITEFSAIRCKDTATPYLSEYCRLITDNAIEKLSPLS